MILNIIVILLIAFMVYWWSAQGAFSSLLHLVLTVLAALFALALWEPLAVKLTLPYLPEYGWGVALLVPFGLILLGLRIGFDKKLTGNLNFNPNIDRALGGVFGFGSAVLTTGILVIGLQMSGLNALLGYKGWELKPGAGPQQEQALWVPVDKITAGVLGAIAGGSMSPVLGEGARGFEYYHPNLAIEASMYHKSAFWSDPAQAARRALNPAHVELMEEGYYVVPQITDGLSRKLGINKEGNKAVAVGVKIALMEAEGGGGGDKDSVFYATRNQVALISRDGEQIHVAHPISVIIADPRGSTYIPLSTVGEYAYSRPSAPYVRHVWIFNVPASAEPQYIRIKGARVELPPVSEAKEEAVALERITAGGATQVAVAPTPTPEPGRLGDPEGRGPMAVGEFVEVADRLPFTMSKNILKSQSVEIVEDAIVSGTARVPSSRERIGKDLAVNRIFAPNGAKIVQVKMGTRKAGSLLGQVIQFAATVTQAPVLRDRYGDYYFAIGFGVKQPAEFKFQIDRNNVIRSLQPLQLGSLGDTDEVTLYYQIPSGTTLVSFDMGTAQKQTLNVQVP